MKKIALLLALALPALFISCGDKAADQQTETIPAGMRAADLSAHGFPLKMNVPDSTKGKLDISESDTWGGAAIRVGKNFQVNVNTADAEAADLNMQKQLLAATDIGENSFSVDNDSTLVYVTQFGEVKRHHFYMVKKIGNEKYIVRDINDPENEFTEDDIKTMMESAKSLRPKPVAAAEPKS